MKLTLVCLGLAGLWTPSQPAALETPLELPLETILSQPSEARQSSDRLLRALPARSLGFAAAWDIAGMQKTLDRSTWMAFLRDEQMQRFTGHFRAWWDEVSAEAMEELPVDPFAVLSSIQGSAVVFAMPPAEGGEIVAGLLVEPGAGREAFEEYLNLLTEMIAEHEPVASSQYGGADLHVFGKGEGLVVARVGGLVSLVGSDELDSALAATRGIVDRYSGGSDSAGLFANADLTMLRAGQKAPHFEVFANLGAIIGMAMLIDPPSKSDLKVIQDLGVDQLRWAYASATVGEGEAFDMAMAMGLPSAGMLFEPLPNILGPLPTGMLESMPADTIDVGIGHIDVKGIFDMVMVMVEHFEPSDYEEMRAGIDSLPDMFGIDLELDVLDQITGSFGTFSIAPTEAELEAAGDEGSMLMMTGGLPIGRAQAVLIELADPGAFEALIDDMTVQFGMDSMIDFDEFAGHDVYSVALGGSLGPSWAFTEDALVIAPMFRSALEAVLTLESEPGAKTAADSERMQKALRMHGHAAGLSLADTKETVRSSIDALVAVSDMLDMFGGLEELERETGFDFAGIPWPSSDVVEGYFRGTVTSTFGIRDNALELRYTSR